ncbi:MAG: 40S ribosomal protein S19 [Candidatus Pacearchaeota archaeon]
MEKNPLYELDYNEYNAKVAEVLKTMPEFKMPEWAAFVKTGVSRNRPPVDNDFWYKRASSILRQIYVRKVLGVNRLRTRYGSRKNRGMKPERFQKASGKIIRVILQQAESAGLIEKYNMPGKRAGRILTEKGKELLEGIK